MNIYLQKWISQSLTQLLYLGTSYIFTTSIIREETFDLPSTYFKKRWKFSTSFLQSNFAILNFSEMFPTLNIDLDKQKKFDLKIN